jgi:predicted nucleic acid-binding protein
MLDRIVIVNSTPIIGLAAINSLYLLNKLYGEICIPEAVYSEISVKKDSKAQIEVDKMREWIKVKRIKKH